MGNVLKSTKNYKVVYKNKNFFSGAELADDIYDVIVKNYPAYMKDLKAITKSHAPIKTGKLRDQIYYRTRKKKGKGVSGHIFSRVLNPIDKFIYSYLMHEGKYGLGTRSKASSPKTKSSVSGVGGTTGATSVGRHYIKTPLYKLGPFYFQHLAEQIEKDITRK